jgi:hypothetical protein
VAVAWQLGEEIELELNQRVSVSLSDLSGALYVFTHHCSTMIDFPGVGAVPLDQASAGVAPRRESAGDGVEVVRPPDPVAGVDHRAIARQLLRALYTMIGHFGMPIKSREASDEVELALRTAEAAKLWRSRDHRRGVLPVRAAVRSTSGRSIRPPTTRRMRCRYDGLIL